MTTAHVHPFRSSLGAHLLVVDGSRVYDIDDETFASCAKGDLPSEVYQLAEPYYVDASPLDPPSLRSISLNVAQGCNMSCSYCYADEGRFGTHARLMEASVALNAVEAFLSQIPAQSDAVLGYIGGEPFLNSQLVHDVTKYAAKKAAEKNIRLRFSITTNATLIRDADVELLSAYPFSVAVSLDGGRGTNDRQRQFRNGDSAYDRIVAGVAKLTHAQVRPRHISLRATVTPRSDRLIDMLDDMLGLGADEVGFAPVLVSPDPLDAFTAIDFERFLDQMIECGTYALSALFERRRLPFSNFETALQQIHKGTHRPYPCGAAATYASVSAEGELFSCHRTINDARFAIGSIEGGTDNQRRRSFLAERHVLRQEPCKSCWARFLCGGGCHQEVLARGRIGCDYIRGWLEFCLGAYVELLDRAPAYFSDPKRYFQ